MACYDTQDNTRIIIIHPPSPQGRSLRGPPKIGGEVGWTGLEKRSDTKWGGLGKMLGLGPTSREAVKFVWTNIKKSQKNPQKILANRIGKAMLSKLYVGINIVCGSEWGHQHERKG